MDILTLAKTKDWEKLALPATLIPYQAAGGAHGKATNSPVQMIPHGKVDPPTLVNLGVYSLEDAFTAEQLAYLKGGKKPGTFSRDFTTTSAQIPRWAWLLAGAGFLGLGVYIYYQSRKQK
jgi:hypothetical protein